MCTVTENIFHPCPPAFRSIRFSRIGKKGKFYIIFFKKIMHTIHSYCFLVLVDTNKSLVPLFYRIFLQPQISASPIFLPMNNLKSGSFPKIIVNSTQPYFWMSILKVKRLHHPIQFHDIIFLGYQHHLIPLGLFLSMHSVWVDYDIWISMFLFKNS